MAFHGKYGHLSSLHAAIQELKDIEKEYFEIKFSQIYDKNIPIEKRYDDMRFLRMIEGLQWVIIKNGGDLTFSKLPDLTNTSRRIYKDVFETKTHEPEVKRLPAPERPTHSLERP